MAISKFDLTLMIMWNDSRYVAKAPAKGGIRNGQCLGNFLHRTPNYPRRDRRVADNESPEPPMDCAGFPVYARDSGVHFSFCAGALLGSVKNERRKRSDERSKRLSTSPDEERLAPDFTGWVSPR